MVSENCKECLYIENLNKEVAELKMKFGGLEDRLNKVEKGIAVSEEQMKMVFKMLSEIKDSIEKIADKIDEIESRPNKLLYTVAGGVIVAVILVGMKFIGK